MHPNIPGELDLLDQWRDELDPSGWKVYTMWEPYDPDVDERDTGWFLDDEEIGLPFLERVQAVGPRVVAVHKGIDGLMPGTGPLASSPRDIGPAAKLFPDITFLVYHSGYEPDVPAARRARGTRRPGTGCEPARRPAWPTQASRRAPTCTASSAAPGS